MIEAIGVGQAERPAVPRRDMTAQSGQVKIGHKLRLFGTLNVAILERDLKLGTRLASLRELRTQVVGGVPRVLNHLSGHDCGCSGGGPSGEEAGVLHPLIAKELRQVS